MCCRADWPAQLLQPARLSNVDRSTTLLRRIAGQPLNFGHQAQLEPAGSRSVVACNTPLSNIPVATKENESIQSPTTIVSGNAPVRSRWFADGVLIATAIMWGVNILVFKSSVGDFSPWVFNGLRLVFATLTLGLLAWGEAVFWPRPARMVNWPRVLAFSFLSGFFYLVTFVQGISMTTAGNTALILASMPMWTAILSYLFLHERLKRVTWMGLMVTFVGTLIVTTQSSGPVSFAKEYFLGNMFMLTAAIAWAAGTVTSKPILETISPLRLAFISALLTTPLHLVIAWFAVDDFASVAQRAASPRMLAAIIYSGVFSTGVAYATWHAGVRAVGGSHAAVYQNIVTLVAVIGGWVFLREQPMTAQILGGCLTIAGLLLMRRGRR